MLYQEIQRFLIEKRTRSRWGEVLSLMVGVLVNEYGRNGLAAANEWLEAFRQQIESKR